jgi:N-acetylglutamate synthase-like GNAT family acetyltransferase
MADGPTIWVKNSYLGGLLIRISTDPTDIDLDWLVPALSERAYWALGRGRDVVERSIANSLCFSAIDGAKQVGFARVVTDQATFAWICDVFVDESMRGRGVGTLLMTAITEDARLAGLKRIALATSSPQFYEQFGFERPEQPDRWMVRRGPSPVE